MGGEVLPLAGQHFCRDRQYEWGRSLVLLWVALDELPIRAELIFRRIGLWVRFPPHRPLFIISLDISMPVWYT